MRGSKKRIHNTGKLYDPQLLFAGDNPDTEAVRRTGSEQEPTSALRGKQCFIWPLGEKNKN